MKGDTLITQFLMILGCFLVIHAAYSLQHYRSLIQDIVESSTGLSLDVDEATAPVVVVAASESQQPQPIVYNMPPMDIWIELCIAFVLIFISELTRSGSSFQRAVLRKGEKSKQTYNKSMMAAAFVSRDFDIYTSRKSKL
jgi:uncharacterized membrane protein